MRTNGGGPNIANCLFVENFAVGEGGGVLNDSGSPVFTDCGFFGNVSGNGGGLKSHNGQVTLIDCSFHGNSSGRGGAIRNETGPMTLVRCGLFGNSAQDQGGAIYITQRVLVGWQRESVPINQTAIEAHSGLDGGFLWQ